MSIKRKNCQPDLENRKSLSVSQNGDHGDGGHDDASSIGGDGALTDVHQEIKYGKPLRALYGLFADYSLNSTIHGVRYICEHKRHWTERAWWTIAFLLSVYGCGRLILNVYNKWDQSPVIVSFAEKSTPVWEIPFPAITICPETKTNISLLNFTAAYHEMQSKGEPPYNLTDDEIMRMEAVAQVCDSHLTDYFKLGQNITGSEIIEILREMAPSFNDTMFFCKFRNRFDGCDELYQEIMTEEGLCFTFNVLNSKELYRDEISNDFIPISHNRSAKYWSLEDGYDPSIPVDPETFPFRVFGSGARVGMYVLLRLYEQHLEYICRGPVQGFKILLHTAGEVPQVSKHYFRVPIEQEVLVSVKPNMITTSEGLRHYEPNRRQCYFNSERQLQFFRVYTQRNCELECLANFTIHKCGCVKFSMPRDNETPICGSANILCYNNAEDELLQKDFLEGISKPSTAKKGCNCLPACTSITYDAEISQAQLDWVNLFNAYNSPMDEFPGMRPSRLSIFFKENQFITSRRSELYGPTDFLANCGGLLGLFMGFSLLSIVEIIYYCTLRLFCNLKGRRRRKTLRRKQQARLLQASTTMPSIIIEDSAILWESIYDYSQNWTIHGIRYIFHEKFHWIERIFWTLAFLLSIYGCSQLILNVYNKWNETPVIVSFADRLTPIWEIPFPAITICPETKAKINLLNLTAGYHELITKIKPPFNLTDDEIIGLEALFQICDQHLLENLNFGKNITTNEIFGILLKLAPSFNETIVSCKFRNDRRNLSYCENFFQTIMTDEGVCFTFNMLSSREIYRESISDDLLQFNHNYAEKQWSLERGYYEASYNLSDTYPYRVYGAGFRGGMFIVVNLIVQHLEFICRGPVQGFKFMLHSPDELPEVSKYFRLSMEEEVLVMIKPNMMTTAEHLRSYEPNRRQCYFNSERQLRFFRAYSQRNCELECLSNFTLQTCGCVKFSMPRDKFSPICGAANILCYDKAEDKLLKLEFINGINGQIPESTKWTSCNCLPACTSITYDAEISQATFNWVDLFLSFNEIIDYGKRPSRLSIIFKENQFITSRRSEMYGLTDFLANCGGILGLSMGFSLLSIVEIIYYCLLRLIWNAKERSNDMGSINMVNSLPS